jgi:hypothetical protein
LAKLVGEIFGDTGWRYKRPSQRKSPGHLQGFDPLKTPIFKWPKELNDFYLKHIREQNKT